MTHSIKPPARDATGVSRNTFTRWFEQRWVTASIVVLLGLMGSGCRSVGSADAKSNQTNKANAPSHFSGKQAQIESFGSRAGFLDVGVRVEARNYRFWLPNTPACLSIIAPETNDEGVRYVERGRAGRLQKGVERCEPSGILNLDAWRMRSGRTPGEGIKRAQASYQVHWRGDGVVLARGRFPLFSRLGISNAYDLIAIIPNDETCASVLDSNTSSMEYRAKGQHVLSLVSGDRLCPVEGVVFPAVSSPKP